MTLSARPPAICVTLSTSTNGKPATSTSSGSTATTGSRPATASPIAFSPCQGRAECALSAPKHEARVDAAEAADLDRVVGRLEDDHEVGLEGQRRGAEDARQRALAQRQLLADEEEERGVVGERGPLLVDPARELDHHRDAALHVRRAEPDDPAVLEPAGDVALCRNRVEVPREEDERLAGARRGVEERVVAAVHEWKWHGRGHVGVDLRLVPAHRRDVDERERRPARS